MLMTSAVPDLTRRLVAHCEGVPAFDELHTPSGADTHRRCDNDMDVIRHDDESMHSETPLIAVTKEHLDEQLGIRCTLEVALSLMRKDRDRVRF